MPARDHDVSSLTDSELTRARRELAASLALARPDSPIRAPALAQLDAIDTEQAGRERTASAMSRMCSCGLASDDDAFLDDHLAQRPDHQQRDLSRYHCR